MYARVVAAAVFAAVLTGCGAEEPCYPPPKRSTVSYECAKHAVKYLEQNKRDDVLFMCGDVDFVNLEGVQTN